jgi:2-amino-4-hydroxy-6-hydroxymethyldihydropteridine diphosphokinase
MKRFPILNTVIIGVGSNIDPQRNIVQAQKLLQKKCRFIAASRLVKTKPIGNKKQADFLNGTFIVATPLPQTRFKAVLKRIESQLGRKRGKDPYGPRTIDLDILVWNGKVVGKDYRTRDFIRKSAQELMPGLA